MAPASFLATTNIDKMKQFIEKFVNSSEVKKEVGEVPNFKEWLNNFKFEAISKAALDELVAILGTAEERSKISLIDLMRLLIQHEFSAAHILNKHWETIDLSIFQYL